MWDEAAAIKAKWEKVNPNEYALNSGRAREAKQVCLLNALLEK